MAYSFILSMKVLTDYITKGVCIMDTIFTRDSTLSPSETLQRASSVLSSIQHPVSFLPSAHFYAASSEQHLVGTAISMDFLQSKVYKSYRKKRFRELSSYCFDTILSPKEFFQQLLGNMGKFLYIRCQPDFFNLYPSDCLPAMLVLANELYEASLNYTDDKAFEISEAFYIDFSRYLFHQIDWWLVHCFYSGRSTMQDFLFTSAFDIEKDSSAMELLSYQLTGYILDLLYYYVSSNGQETNCSKAAFRESIAEDKQEIASLNQQVTSLTALCTQLKKDNLSYKRQLEQSFSQTTGEDEKIGDIQRELEQVYTRLKKISWEKDKLTEKNAQLIEENHLLEQLFSERNREKNGTTFSSIDYSLPFLFVGGHYSTVDKLRFLFPNSRFIFNDKEVPKILDLSTCKAMFVFTSFVSHTLYNKTKSMCKSAGIPVIHVNHSGLKAVLGEISSGYTMLS